MHILQLCPLHKSNLITASFITNYICIHVQYLITIPLDWHNNLGISLVKISDNTHIKLTEEKK